MVKVLYLYYLLVVIPIIIRILARNNISASARLAWFIVTIVLPLFGSLSYLFFGEIHISKETRRRHREAFDQINRLGGEALGDHALLESRVDQPYQPAFKFSAQTTGFNVTGGNRAHLLADAEAFLQSLVQDIDNASESINILYYIWLTDNTGLAVVDALIRASGRGVKCRVMVDRLGSSRFIKSDNWQKLQAAGIEVSAAMPFKTLLASNMLNRYDLRNHRKITVIDGEITYCGSQNCADPEFRVKPAYAPWVDIMVRFEGPVAAQSQLLFASDWMIHQHTPLDTFLKTVPPRPDGQVLAQVRGHGPTETRFSTALLLSTLCHQAQRELIISTPYFVPDVSVLGALSSVARRGVDVRLILPARNDSWIVAAASRSHYRFLVESGVKVHEFRGGLLHSKTLTVDGVTAMIGSTNIDMRSFDLNYENDMLLFDADLVGQIRTRQLAYIADSNTVDAATVAGISLPRRIWNNIFGTFGPVL